MSVLSKRHNK